MSRTASAHHVRHSLHVAVVGGVAWLRLERPREGNRITCEMAQEVCAALQRIELDDRIRVVVLSSQGPSFCLGVEAGGEWEQRADWIGAVGGTTRPVIAAVQGDAMAEGLELLLACDLRIAAAEARFAMPQLLQGRLPSHGGTQRLARIVGRTRGLDLLLTGRTIEATEAESIGLVNRVVSRPRLDLTVRQLAADLSSKGPLALRYAKEAILKGSDMALGQGIRLEEDLYALLQTTADRREGVRALLRKRRPIFKGK